MVQLRFCCARTAMFSELPRTPLNWPGSSRSWAKHLRHSDPQRCAAATANQLIPQHKTSSLTVRAFAALVSRGRGGCARFKGNTRIESVAALKRASNRSGDMSEGQGGASAPASRNLIRSPRDFWGVLSLVLVAAFAIWASSDLPAMRGFAFGPGTAPRMFAYCLMALGFGVRLVGRLTDGPPMEDYSFTGTFGGAVLVVALIPIYF